jgi:hypothetical protein
MGIWALKETGCPPIKIEIPRKSPKSLKKEAAGDRQFPFILNSPRAAALPRCNLPTFLLKRRDDSWPRTAFRPRAQAAHLFDHHLLTVERTPSPERTRSRTPTSMGNPSEARSISTPTSTASGFSSDGIGVLPQAGLECGQGTGLGRFILPLQAISCSSCQTPHE